MTDVSHERGLLASTGWYQLLNKTMSLCTPFDFNKPAYKHRGDSNGSPWVCPVPCKEKEGLLFWQLRVGVTEICSPGFGTGAEWRLAQGR